MNNKHVVKFAEVNCKKKVGIGKIQGKNQEISSILGTVV